MQKLGGMGGVLGMLPGVAKIKGQINEAGLDKSLVHQRAIISSMTAQERRNPKVLDARRKRRIAAGSGTKVEDINKLVKMHRQMADMMKTMGRNGGMLNKFLGRTGGGPSEAEMRSMQAELSKLDPESNLEQLPEELRDQVAKGLSSSGSRSRPDARPRARPSGRLAGARRRTSKIPGASRKEKVNT